MANRLEFLRRTHGFELARRRFAGSSAASDRAFFLFVESARRSLPADTRGVALFAPDKSAEELYLASYELAPLPVRVAPAALAPGWVAAFYGAPPDGWTVLRAVPGGAVAVPPKVP